MFTINQIRQAHSKVKSGADFPQYIQDLKALGIVLYEHYVSDGHIEYFGANDFKNSSEANGDTHEIEADSDVEKLQYALSIHQQGQTDYNTFCRQAAEAGVEKWIVDMQEMVCTYFDKQGNKMITETIPTI